MRRILWLVSVASDIIIVTTVVHYYTCKDHLPVDGRLKRIDASDCTHKPRRRSPRRGHLLFRADSKIDASETVAAAFNYEV